ncbi:Fibrillin-2-like [Oopsacas minuta]|uniref:Fibrillin-2-like n=1 Tax=Oopsacas minuta TaxID=111878 RepID=A0AAV7JGR1_9METZ|nr:Fibrillin-2-like [Oopsacas minuta]
MGKFGNICLLLGLVTYLYYYAVVEAVDCSNGAGYCDYYSNDLQCYITNNDTQVIKSLLSNCSGQSTAFVTIYIYKNYVSTVYGNLIIDIELASNIQLLNIYNVQDHDNIRLTTSSQNTGLRRITIYSNYHIQLESGNFFNYFTGLKYIFVGYCITKETPSFTNLQYLRSLSVRIVGASTRTFDNTIVRGLSNLVYLRFYNSDFNSITNGALDGLNSLTYLSFDKNKLSSIEDGTFSELSSLLRLYLPNNGIKTASNNGFEGLTQLTYLGLDENPEFPIEALLKSTSVVGLSLQYNDYHTLEPYVFQQMKSLTSIYLNDPFACDCRLQWTSIVSQYGVYIYNGFCSEPNNFLNKDISNPQLYTNCSQTESYQCFDKSTTCPSNQVCHNTQDGYFCGCPVGYLQHSSGECVDEDECGVGTECEHVCENTEGSYHCVCEEGYKLATNGYVCDDVNECKIGNGGCEFGCGNTIGSYLCYCEYGHQLINITHCESDIQCDVVDSSNNEEYQFICDGGFNLTITNFTCQSTTITTPTCSTAQSTISPTFCPIGYSLHNSGECKDFDECNEATDCAYACENTEGSYLCVCDEGYTLAANGYACDDINECQEGNGGCEFGCQNIIGSYLCYCQDGRQLINKTHCESNIQCDVVDSSGDEEYRFVCHGGFNLTITNLTCHSFPDSTLPSTTVSTESPTNCPIGYSLHNSGECKDVDECDEETNCEHACENTEGSYYCTCNEGYTVSPNGYDCEDVNGCYEWNGGCEFGCRNFIGSFECYCDYGHQLYNKTHCEDGIECELMEKSCINEMEHIYSCKGGFNITIHNLSCPNVDTLGNATYQTSDPTSSFTPQAISPQNQFEWYQPTVIFMSISLVSNVFLILMFIALFLYFVRKVNKLQGILKGKATNNHRILRAGYSSEIYCMHESGQTDELKNTTAIESELIEKKDPNLIAEIYSGSVQTH